MRAGADIGLENNLPSLLALTPALHNIFVVEFMIKEFLATLKANKRTHFYTTP